MVQPSPGAAARAVDPIDVDHGEVDFLAADGTVLVPAGAGHELVLRRSDQRRPDELRRRLRLYLSETRLDLDPALADDPAAAAHAILLAGRRRQPRHWLSRLARSRRL
jgi:hypothetical protein